MDERPRDLRTEVLAYLTRFVAVNGFPPTCDEIRHAVGLSSRSHAAYYLDALEREGLVVRTPRSPRGLRLVRPRPGGNNSRGERATATAGDREVRP